MPVRKKTPALVAPPGRKVHDVQGDISFWKAKIKAAQEGLKGVQRRQRELRSKKKSK